MRHKTANDLSKSVRAEVVDLLAPRLADLIDLHLQLKQAHWTVRGPNFIAYHELFDKLADEVEEFADEVAERIGQLGGQVEGTARATAKASTLKEYPSGIAGGREHIEALTRVISDAGAKMRKAIDSATKAGDADTADLFTGISRGLDKSLWFIESHAQAKD